MKGNEFPEGKQHSEGNKVLLPVLQHLHQRQTLVALIASPSPKPRCLGLSFLEEKHRNLVPLPLLKANGAACCEASAVLKPHSCQVGPCRYFYG